MSVAWWCQTCGGPVEQRLLVVRVGATALGERSLGTFCSDRCADLGRGRSDAAVTEVRVAAEPARPRTVLEELLAVD
jgi:hypothetical protein